MQIERYQLSSDQSFTIFEFISDGPKGKIPKLVIYSETNKAGIYNLAFGDKNHTTGEIQDDVVSNNGDSRKVLATVAATAYVFTEKFPDAWIYATGLTASRTRLYQIGISTNFETISVDFDVYGSVGGSWERFQKNRNYEAFLARRIKS